MSDILCAELLGGCEGTGFWPGWPGDPGVILGAAALTFFIALALFVYRYLLLRREMRQ